MTQPVAVNGAQVGDTVAISIKGIVVTFIVTASGNDRAIEGWFVGDPFIAYRLSPTSRNTAEDPSQASCDATEALHGE